MRGCLAGGTRTDQNGGRGRNSGGARLRSALMSRGGRSGLCIKGEGVGVGGGGGKNPKGSVPKTAKAIFPFVHFGFSHFEILVREGGGVRPPPSRPPPPPERGGMGVLDPPPRPHPPRGGVGVLEPPLPPPPRELAPRSHPHPLRRRC